VCLSPQASTGVIPGIAHSGPAKLAHCPLVWSSSATVLRSLSRIELGAKGAPGSSMASRRTIRGLRAASSAQSASSHGCSGLLQGPQLTARLPAAGNVEAGAEGRTQHSAEVRRKCSRTRTSSISQVPTTGARAPEFTGGPVTVRSGHASQSLWLLVSSQPNRSLILRPFQQLRQLGELQSFWAQ
jgi:hypothetical protein